MSENGEDQPPSDQKAKETPEVSDDMEGLARAFEKREARYAAIREDVYRRQLSNSEAFDKAVLTLSSAAIGVTLTFAKSAGVERQYEDPNLLLASWGLFTLAITATILSFFVGQSALARYEDLAYQLHIDDDERALTAGNRWAMGNKILNYTAGGAFLLGLACTLLFCGRNL